jgi:hypothetical protein
MPGGWLSCAFGNTRGVLVAKGTAAATARVFAELRACGTKLRAAGQSCQRLPRPVQEFTIYGAKSGHGTPVEGEVGLDVRRP